MDLKKLILLVDATASKTESYVAIAPVDWANIVAVCTEQKAERADVPNMLVTDAKIHLTKAKKIHTCKVCGEFISEGDIYKNYKVKAKSGFWSIFKAHASCGLQIKGFHWDGRNTSVVL